MIPDLTWVQWFLCAYLTMSWLGAAAAIMMIGKPRQPYTSRYALFSLGWALALTALIAFVVWPELS